MKSASWLVCTSLALVPGLGSLSVNAQSASPELASPKLAEKSAAIIREKGSRTPMPARITFPQHSEIQAINTDRKGHFVLPAGLSYPVDIWVVAPGYQGRAFRLEAPQARPPVLYLQPLPPNTIVVTEDGSERQHVIATTLPREMVEQTPGTYTDAVRLVQALPGVTQTPEYSPKAGLVAVRGTGPTDNRFFLDGLDLPYLFHFQQYGSVVPTYLIEELTLYPSTFRPTFGNAVGAVIDARTRDYQPDTLHATVNVNLIMAGGSIEAPVGEYATLVAGGRRSFFDKASENSTEYAVWPIFWDYHMRYDYRRADGRRIGLFAYGAGDKHERYVLDPTEPDPISPDNDQLATVNQSFQAVGARCSLGYGQAYTSESLVAAVFSVEETVLATGEREGLKDDYLYVRHDGEMAFNEHWHMNLGGEVKGSALAYQGDPRGGAFAWPEPELPTPDQAYLTEELLRVTGGLYVEATRISTRGTSIKPGVRVDTDSLSQSVTVDPRLTLAIPLNEDIGLRAAAGIYHQSPDALYAYAGPATARQLAFGAEMTVSGRLRAHAQAYYKDLSNVLGPSAPGSGTDDWESSDGSSAGAEITLRYHIQDKIFSWFSYAYNRASRVDADGNTTVFDFEQPHAVNLVLSYIPNSNWNFGLRYRLSSGLPYTEVESAIFDSETGEYEAIPGERNAARFPTYQKIDGHIERQWTFDRWTLALYSEFWMVAPGGNVLYPLYSYDYSEIQYVGGPSFVPLVGIRGKL